MQISILFVCFYLGIYCFLLHISPFSVHRVLFLKNFFFLFLSFSIVQISSLLTLVCISVYKLLPQKKSCLMHSFSMLIISLIRTFYTNPQNKLYKLIFRLYRCLWRKFATRKLLYTFKNVYFLRRNERVICIENLMSSHSAAWFHLFAEDS